MYCFYFSVQKMLSVKPYYIKQNVTTVMFMYSMCLQFVSTTIQSFSTQCIVLQQIKYYF